MLLYNVTYWLYNVTYVYVDEALDGSVTVAEVILALTERDLRQGTELINLEIYNGPEESSTAAGDGVIHGYQLNLETSSTLKIFTGLLV